jgi:7-keto-8-aminopelargonate synthetase-like enzyme
MKKLPSPVELIESAFDDALEAGVVHLSAEDEQLDGRTLRIRGRRVLNFASCSYLGLELDPRVRAGVASAVERYGSQFSSSRAYLSAPPYEELESLLGRIFQAPVLVTPSTTLAHLSALPVLVGESDAVILDHQVHQSVQLATTLLRAQGTTVELVRHGAMDLLEDKIVELSASHRRVWYMGDGLYSMYGDFAPAKALGWLLARHEQLHLYMDDAHAMGWMGRHGRGFAAEAFSGHERVVIAVSLSKSFAAAGGALVFPDEAMYRKVRRAALPLIFGGPIQPPMLGAAIASARIHLSPEIESLQRELRERIDFANRTARELDLPLARDTAVPIRFVGTCLTPAALDLVAALLDRGFCMNPAGFPAVGSRRAGARFTITRHHTEQDVRTALETMAEELPGALRRAGISRTEVNRAFRLGGSTAKPPDTKPAAATSLSLYHERSIRALDAGEWNACLGQRGVFDVASLALFEEVFGPHQPPENRWDFHYFIVRDESGRIVLATFFTEALWKDDLLAAADVSGEVERRRSADPYFLTSRTLSMGALLTEGDHLYLDRGADWRGALRLLVAALEEVREDSEAASVVIRDLPAEDEEIGKILQSADFLRVGAPDTWVVEVDWASPEEFMRKLASHERRFHRRHVQPHDDSWELEILEPDSTGLESVDWKHLHGLYRNVQQRQLALNTFPLPEELLPRMLETEGWELLLLRLREDQGGEPSGPPQGFVACRAGSSRYDWLLIGMNYEHLESRGRYRQLVAQVVRRAEKLGLPRVGLGMGSERVKKRFRGRPEQRVMYVQSADQFQHDVLSMLESDSRRNGAS